MKTRLDALGMQATFWTASTPDTIVDYFQSFCNAGQKACAQSHILVWKHILEKNLDYALVIEDDACFDKDWKAKLDRFVPPEDWDSICLNVSEPVEPRDTWVEAHDQYLTGGYILSRKGCEALFNLFRNNYGSSDWMTTCLQRDNHCYTYCPGLIIQEGDESTIGSGVEADGWRGGGAAGSERARAPRLRVGDTGGAAGGRQGRMGTSDGGTAPGPWGRAARAPAARGPRCRLSLMPGSGDPGGPSPSRRRGAAAAVDFSFVLCRKMESMPCPLCCRRRPTWAAWPPPMPSRTPRPPWQSRPDSE